MADKTLTCKDCGAEFVFTAGEQQFYAEKFRRARGYECAHSGNGSRYY